MSLRPPRFLLLRLAWRARRRWAVGCYLRKLPNKLFDDYEHGETFKPLQVEATLRRHGMLSPAFLPYAQVLYCDAGDVKQAWRDAGIELDYGLVRRWLGDAFFRGRENFTAAAVARYAERPGWPCDPSGQEGASIVG